MHSLRNVPRLVQPLCLVAVLAAALGSPGQDLPGFVPLEQRLEQEIRKLIDAGHLAPGLSTFEQHYRGDAFAWGWELDDYWHNPAETVYTLALAIPHLPAQLRAEAKEYLRSEFERFPPTEFVHIGPEGARREYAELPPEFGADWPRRHAQADTPQTQAHWPGWSFNPFNIYASFKYAELFPEQAGGILNALRDKVAALPDDEGFLRERPHVLNVYIAGYFGFHGLQDLAGEARSEQVQSWLDGALAMRLELFETPPEQVQGFEAGGFMWLTPELGGLLHEKAREEVQQAVRYYDWAAPYWFVSNAQETTRFSTERTFMEGYHAHIYDTMSQFQARAYALKLSRPDLERYIDASSVRRGDLYYIQNLCAAIAASPGGVRRSRDRRYSLKGEAGGAEPRQ